ncbi:MAG: DNRLRE domain-containing protein [Anaerolineae bacterium]|nr:DNRLRE domain-containing protein [Anaerolineae bacterium]
MRKWLNSKKPLLILVLLITLGLQVALPNSWMRQLHLSILAATTITFEPASVSLGVGDDTWLTIRINDVEDLYGADIRIAFDPSVIEVLDAIPPAPPVNIEPGTMPYPDMTVKNEADNSAGDIWYVVSQLNPRPPASGSGTLARIHIRGLANGSTTLTFINHELSTSGGFSIPNTAGSCTVIVGGGTATETATPSPTATEEATPSPTATEGSSPTPSQTPSTTPTPSITPTSAPTFTPYPTSTATATPSITPTPLPSATSPPTSTPTASPTPGMRTFSGRVYEGGFGDTSHPLAGVEVQLWGSWTAGHPGIYLTRDTTDAQGRFEITYVGSYPHYSLIEVDPPGYISTGASPGTGGIVPDSSGNWVEFRNALPGLYSGTLFFDRPAEGTLTPTSTATPLETATVSPPGTPVYESQRAAMDTYINEREPQTNYGRLGHLHLGMHATGPIKTALLWFDLSEVPQGARVSEATLFLFGRDVDPTVPLCVSQLLRPWEEYEATWLEASEGVPWDVPGALGVGTDHEAPCLQGEFKDEGQIQFYEWDVREMVQGWIDGTHENYGFIVMIPEGAKAKETHGLYSREYSEFALRPFLALLYTEPTPTFTPTLTPTYTATATPTCTPTATPTPCQAFLPVIWKMWYKGSGF